jgi:hypothetical protein
MFRVFAALSAFLSFAAASPAFAAEQVDVALVLAVDVSASITPDRYELQRNGLAAAFTNSAVVEAVRSGDRQAIAVTLVEWSGPSNQKQVIGWTVVRDAPSARAFSSAIAESPRAFSDFTSISAAVDYSVQLLQGSGFDSYRKVIDVSGDGANNSGRSLADARETALAAGITINGLAILGNESGLETYYRENVIGGDGSFMIVAENFNAFSNAMLNKLVREIAAVRTLPYSVASLGW